ncbi:UDP-glucose 4-epimerase GalE [Micrococcus sp. HOU01]|uniref:UDP-glucose 4-epimerase GalE n=1 Tax=Micrococcus sp. HOU01 TaxID=3101753 RepID=UPI002D79C6DC|nr:UDP-glucose 4-epimerase GalE [Micrococcus sp. HOU1]WRQ43310.1 UDP-glucose 4-epimerase GalE [Micrococcus sp. HOU1]
MTWVVTGGAGYIGSHVVGAFLEAGMPVAVVDNLSTGRRDFVPEGVPFDSVDITDTASVARVLRAHGAIGVVHVAGYKYAGESVTRPLVAYRTNVQGTASVLEAMHEAGVEDVVFSSSAAVYGTPEHDRVTEGTPPAPESPYGETKLIGEWLLADQARATGLRHTSLRYFNVVGSAPSGAPDLSPHNLFPLVFSALERGERPRIFGEDYPTPDGTCVRDYVHVVDVARAHVQAALALQTGRRLQPVYNLGSGEGTSVREIIDALLDAAGADVEPEVRERRAGDPARIVADGASAQHDLRWEPSRSVAQMARSAWDARRRFSAA